MSTSAGDLGRVRRTAWPTVATRRMVPATPGYLILRQRLLDVLDAGVCRRVTLLSAPAGSGKTVLLGSWIETRRMPGPICWLSLDADHNDASRLGADLLSALRDAHLIKRGSALDGLAPPSGARADRFLAVLINGLCRLRAPFVVVLDDAHELTSPQASGMIDFLVRHAPSHCRLVLAGRVDPPVPIERLRVSGELTELRADRLAFDPDETGALYRQLGVELSEAQLQTLLGRTEGWAAALRLAALSLQGHPDPDSFLSDFAGTDRTIADYLVSEVLTRLGPDRREFVLHTCLVETVNAELADALTGRGDGARALDALEHGGAPIHRVRAEEPTFRYHPLFAELLRAHLHHAQPDEVPLLHRRAAHWFAGRGEGEAAIRHALAGGDWELAASTICENWLELFLSGSSGPLRKVMRALPEEVIEAYPLLAACYAGSRLEDGDLAAAERYLAFAEAADDTVGQASSDRLRITLSVLGLTLARLRSDLAESERRVAELDTLAGSPGEPQWARLRAFALCNLGATTLWSGDWKAAARPLEQGLSLASDGGCEQIVLDCSAQIALIRLIEGAVGEAAEMASAALGLAERCAWGEGPAVACAYLAGAAVAYWRGEFELAEGLSASAAGAAETADLHVRIAAKVILALTLSHAGARSAGQAMLKLQAARVALNGCGGTAPVFLQLALTDAELRTMLAVGELDQAAQRLAELRSCAPESRAVQLHLASLALSRGQHDEAGALLEEVLAEPGQNGGPTLHPVARIEAVLLRAQLEHQAGTELEACAALEQALELAEREHVYAPFLLRASELRELFEHQAGERTAHPALLEAILAGGEDRADLSHANDAIAEPLTERELRILRYLPTMLTNAEIGAEIFVSLNTVKTHLRSIYRKLDAGSRAEAVDRARALGLLPRGIKRPRVARTRAVATRDGGRRGALV